MKLKHRSVAALAAAVVSGAFLAAGLVSADVAPGAAGPQFLDQGADWTPSVRADFYTQDQGSRIIPLAWIQALATADGRPFLADNLARYGYLPNPGNDAGLPVGFTTSGPQGSEFLGMSCAACHTREIDVDGKTYRVDGGPAISDFQTFLTDLDAAVGQVDANPAAFSVFAAKVLGPGATPAQTAALHKAVDLWRQRQHTLFTRAFPKGGWGLGRLDAVSMIFDRLTGLDIGPAPSGIIAANIQPADAPVRYPFIWNAPRQDLTQWPGFSQNGDDILGLARNLGEVYGVFAEFSPKKNPHNLIGADFLVGDSANFDGLTKLEKLVRKIGAPKWPWPVDAEHQASADRGAAIFAGEGACASCHGIAPGAMRLSLQSTWKTPLVDTGTDTHEYDVLKRTASTGVLAGAGLPSKPLKANEKQFDILAVSVVGSIAQKYTPFGAAMRTGVSNVDVPAGRALVAALPPQQQTLLSAFQNPAAQPAAAAPTYPYEARVLQGIWATAPYLHNGSVPTLADLLKPPADRPASFAVGRAYDTTNVGLAASQPGSTAMRVTTGCDNRNSGNSRCGHIYGTTLTPQQKLDLLEYLKTL